MVTIKLNTWVNAPEERCFKLATSVEFRIVSARPLKEKAVSGVTRGLLREGDTVKFLHDRATDAVRWEKQAAAEGAGGRAGEEEERAPRGREREGPRPPAH